MRYIDKPEQEAWLRIADQAKAVSAALAALQFELITSSEQIALGDISAVLIKVNSAEEKISGLSYMCTPQPEWTGGESYRIRAPHITNAR